VNLNQITLPVRDIDAAAAFYRRPGFVQTVDTPHHPRFECPNGGATFSLSLSDAEFSNGAIIDFESDRLDGWFDELVGHGIDFDQPPTDMRYRWREAVLRDPSGNRIKRYHADENRRYPPRRVEIRDDFE
jgi:catechol 2,3-dioxygenase-like lactoylglutathione lyase family enzyme